MKVKPKLTVKPAFDKVKITIDVELYNEYHDDSSVEKEYVLTDRDFKFKRRLLIVVDANFGFNDRLKRSMSINELFIDAVKVDLMLKIKDELARQGVMVPDGVAIHILNIAPYDPEVDGQNAKYL